MTSGPFCKIIERYRPERKKESGLKGISQMRVTTGTARGRNLAAPPDSNITRPTSDMTKQAIFNIIQFEVEGAVVADLYAGSGQLGIEALSRGARRATFVEINAGAMDTIVQNLKTSDMTGRARIMRMDDIAFLDPPYEQGKYEGTLPLVVQRMNPGGVILCETSKEEILPDEVGDFCKQKEYRYGRAKLTVYRRKEKEEE